MSIIALFSSKTDGGMHRAYNKTIDKEEGKAKSAT
jgi:hypothetical protein